MKLYAFGLALLAVAAFVCFREAAALTSARTGIPLWMLIYGAEVPAKGLMIATVIAAVAAAFATVATIPAGAAFKRKLEAGLAATALGVVLLGLVGGLYGEAQARHLAELNGGDALIGVIARVPALFGGGVAAIAAMIALAGALLLHGLRSRAEG